MDLMEHIRQGQGGRLPALLGAAAGLQPWQAEDLLRRQLPLITQRIEELTTRDEAAREALFDIVDHGEAEDYLNDVRALTSRAAVRDGEELLEHFFGSLQQARARARNAGAPPEVPVELAERFFTYSAVLAVAAMSRRWRMEVMPALRREPAKGTGAAGPAAALAGGLLGTVLAALIDGLIRGLLKGLRPRRRRRAPYARRYRRHSRRRSRRRTGRARRRSRRRAGLRLEEIITEILKG
jgi:hypothetical protein